MIKKYASKTYLRDQLDELTSRILRARHPYCCTCGRNWKLTASHIFGRGHGPTRFDIEPGGNLAVQCLDCNLKHATDKGPLYGWYTLHNGDRALEDLERRANSEKHWGYSELWNKWVEYKNILKHEQAA